MNNTWKENNTLIKIKEYSYKDFRDYGDPETESYHINYGYFVVALTEDDLALLKSDDHKKQKDALTRAYIITAYIEDRYGDYDVAPLNSRDGEESKKNAINWFNTEFAQKVIATKPSNDWKFVLLYLEDENLLADLTWGFDYYDIWYSDATYWSPAEGESFEIEDSLRMYWGDNEDHQIVGPNTSVKYLLKSMKDINSLNKENCDTVLEDASWVEDDSQQANFKIIDELTR